MADAQHEEGSPTCLNDEQVAHYVRGTLAYAEQDRADVHMDRCTSCRWLVSAYARTSQPSEAEEVLDPELRTATPGRYELGEVLARGGQGRVLRGQDTWLGRPIAIKIPGSTGAARRLAREAVITARLQHPAIVPVYDAACDEFGSPFYAMKLVDGQSLDRLIAAGPRLEDRLTLIPRVLAVADAIAYAHSQGVIHRDLKPSNVLVGAFGETVVIDWGLAKNEAAELDHLSVEEPRATPTGELEDRLTLAGTVLGTPGYMAPEQARGETVDARADVYALGAMLYHVLNGLPPRKTEAAQFPRAIPRDLVTITRKAMATDPSDRYTNAGELAADLRRFEDGLLVSAHAYSLFERLRRFIARYRAPLAVTVVALIVVASISVVLINRVLLERSQAQEERRRAENQQAAAERLIDFVGSRLHERLDVAGRLDILADVGETVTGYYHSLERTTPLSPEQEARRIAAQLVAGDVAWFRADLARASAAYEAARVELIELDSRHRTLESLRALTRAIVGLLFVARERNDLAAFDRLEPEATSAFAAAQAIAPDDQSILRKQIVFHELRGEADRLRGKRDQARAAYADAREIAERLSAKDPMDLSARHELAWAIYRQVLVEPDHDVVYSLLSDVIATCRLSAAIDVQNTRARHDLQQMLLLFATIAPDLGRIEEAKKAAEESLALSERLVEIDRTHVQWSAALIASHSAVASIEARLGNRREARQRYESALALAEELARRTPENRQNEREIADLRKALDLLDRDD